MQVIEADLFPSLSVERLAASRREISLIRTAVTRLAAAGADTMPSDAYLFDAMRQELARVATLGLAGFDVTTSGDAISEAADAIDGIARAFEPYRKALSRRDRRALEAFDTRVADATKYLREHRDFDRSCASCHSPDLAFTDGRARAALIPGHTTRGGGRNTPTLVNAALQPTLFDDGRVRTLEDQATDVLGSSAEMGGSLSRSAASLSRDEAMVARFVAAFAVPRDSALRPQTLRLALAAYVRSLVALDSRYDRAMRGNTSAMSKQERDGFNLFMGKAHCGTCHFAPLFNGAMPPSFIESEPEVIGVPSSTARHATVDPDSGRFNVRRIDLHLFAFKTPTLRNIELTAPYMHNGVFRTLEEVVDFYDGGGGHGVGIRVQQTLPTDSLRLSREEKSALVAFMRALTDTAGTSRR